MEEERFIQFGEGNFLRGFADAFIQQLHSKGLCSGKIVLVKPTPRGDYSDFVKQGCKYNLFLHGGRNGMHLSEHTHITAISRIISPYDDWQGFLRLAENAHFRFILSNTTESGIVFDSSCKRGDAPPSSFPAKLTLLLHRRFKTGLSGFILLPCELIDNNGDELKKCVLGYADLWKLGADFKAWVNAENRFSNTLVDRIVTGFPKDDLGKYRAVLGYDDRLLVTAELYHRWVIDGNFEKELPFKAAGLNVVWTDDVQPYKKQKVRILNGAHTAVVCAALAAGLTTVGECMQDGDFSLFLHKCLFDEILPAMGKNEADAEFANAVLERFKNPDIKHKLGAIALNCADKYRVRVLPSVKDYTEKFGTPPPCLLFALAALIYYYKTGVPRDNEQTIAAIRQGEIREILKNTALWGADLEAFAGKVTEDCNRIKTQGVRGALKWIL